MRSMMTGSILFLLLVSCDSPQQDAKTTKEVMHSDDVSLASPPPDMMTVMRSKVSWSSSLLEAVATRDYERVATNADALQRLSMESGFIAQSTLAYRTLAEQFRNDVSKLATNARKRDQRAVEADYIRVTESCFHCHEHVRAERLKSGLPGSTGM